MKTDYSSSDHITSVDHDLEINYLCHVNESSWYIHSLLTYLRHHNQGLCPGDFYPGELSRGQYPTF